MSSRGGDSLPCPVYQVVLLTTPLNPFSASLRDSKRVILKAVGNINPTPSARQLRMQATTAIATSQSYARNPSSMAASLRPTKVLRVREFLRA